MTTKEEKHEPRHCDWYVHDPTVPAVLRWFVLINRMPAMSKMLAEEMGVKPKLFATYQGKRVRVVMASRMGDVGITENLEREIGYETRVMVEELSDFTDFA